MIKKICEWLPLILLLLIPIALLIMHTMNYGIYIINSEKYPWIINTEKVSEIAQADSVSSSSLELLNNLKKEGLVISPQEFTNHTFNFFSWLLTVLVAVIGIVVLIFGFNIERKIETMLDNRLKIKWLELMRVDKEVDSTIGGIIDDKIEQSMSDDLKSISDRLQKIEDTTITFKTE